MPAARSTLAALVRSCHPAPTVAVTVMATVLAAAAGDAPGTVGLLLLAVLSGQLSIGWSNDLLDAERDRVAGRTDKPLAVQQVDRRVLVVALAVAVAAVLPLSFALGLPAAAAHLLGVASGWLYNLGLKATPLSPVAYVVAFGALPSVATLARAVPALPPWWVTAAAALLGLGAHFGNVLPDIEDDERTGVRGLPHRIGPRGTGIVAALAVSAAAVVLLRSAVPTTAAVVLLGVLVLVLAAAVVVSTLRDGRPRWVFAAVMVAAAVCVAMLVLGRGLEAGGSRTPSAIGRHAAGSAVVRDVRPEQDSNLQPTDYNWQVLLDIRQSPRPR